jgi:hypothetical protein
VGAVGDAELVSPGSEVSAAYAAAAAVAGTAGVVLDASLTTDADGSNFMVQWALDLVASAIVDAAEPLPTIADPTAAATAVLQVASIAGNVYAFRLTATDVYGAACSTTVYAGGRLGVAFVGGATAVVTSDETVVDASASISTWPLAQLASVEWTVLAAPPGTLPAVEQPGGLVANVSGLVAAGTYLLEVNITDLAGISAVGVLTLERRAAPLADVQLALAVQGTATRGAVFALDAFGCADPVGLGLTYQWSLTDPYAGWPESSATLFESEARPLHPTLHALPGAGGVGVALELPRALPGFGNYIVCLTVVDGAGTVSAPVCIEVTTAMADTMPPVLCVVGLPCPLLAGLPVPPSPSPSPSVSPSASPSVTASPSASPSNSVTPSASPSVTASLSASPSVTASPSASPSITVRPSVSPSVTASPSVSPSVTASPSLTPSVSPSPVIIVPDSTALPVWAAVVVGLVPAIAVTGCAAGAYYYVQAKKRRSVLAAGKGAGAGKATANADATAAALQLRMPVAAVPASPGAATPLPFRTAVAAAGSGALAASRGQPDARLVAV